MATPKDSAALECYRQVLLNFGHVTNYVQWESLPQAWLALNLPNASTRRVRELMIAHVQAGGQVDQVEEKRPEYIAWRFHYDLRISIHGRSVYIETVLEQQADPEDCTIWIVNMHDQ